MWGCLLVHLRENPEYTTISKPFTNPLQTLMDKDKDKDKDKNMDKEKINC